MSVLLSATLSLLEGPAVTEGGPQNKKPTVDDINLHYPHDRKLWELWYIPNIIIGNAGFISPTVEMTFSVRQWQQTWPLWASVRDARWKSLCCTLEGMLIVML